MTVALNGHAVNGNGHALTNGNTSTAKSHGFSTLAIHTGAEADPTTGAVIPPISLSTTYQQSGIGIHKGYEYSRSSNPNRDALEALLAKIESGGSEALAFSSGSAATAAIITAIESDAESGKRPHILSVNDVYGGTHRYLHRVSHCEVTMLDFANITAADIRPDTRLIWIETPTNPTLRIIDIQRVVSLLPTTGPRPLVLVDNTFLSPFYQSPLLLGADIVLHSLTKYVNGHSDVLAGALILPERHSALAARLRFFQNAMGAVPSPFDCFMLMRGAKTLALRMKAHGQNALALARTLSGHPLVKSLAYPGLTPPPLSSLSPHAQRWVSSLPETSEEGIPLGGMVSFTIHADDEDQARRRADKFLTSTKLFVLAESLGGVESLAEHPAGMTHMGVPEADRLALGISQGLVRLSVGVEDQDDLVRDVLGALEEAGRVQ